MAVKEKLPGLPIRATITWRKPSTYVLGVLTPGDVYNLSLYDGYALVIFIKPDKVIAKFSKNDLIASGFLLFEDTSEETEGKTTIEIPADRTKGLMHQLTHFIGVIQADDSGDPFPIGTLDGKSYEFVKLTLNPLDQIPDLS